MMDLRVDPKPWLPNEMNETKVPFGDFFARGWHHHDCVLHKHLYTYTYTRIFSRLQPNV